jgi:ArsR family transcriptional regulator, arsenate/arsenite/antimonite-responsive transcriptional repressor / arsenate reductase (thioredoxin)
VRTASNIPASTVTRAERYAALGDAVRLAIVDELTTSDRAPAELQSRFGIPSNLLAHHLNVLERVGLISRRRSAGDGRRRYIHLERGGVLDMPVSRAAPRRVLFVCTHNSARSPLAAALWQRATGHPAVSAGTQPAARVHPGAVAAARRDGLDIGAVVPQHLDNEIARADLVITVCDRAHEELAPSEEWLHWSVADPVPARSAAAFNAARDDLQQRVDLLARSTGVVSSR